MTETQQVEMDEAQHAQQNQAIRDLVQQLPLLILEHLFEEMVLEHRQNLVMMVILPLVTVARIHAQLKQDTPE